MNEHDYKISELGLTEMTKGLGITKAELRQCKNCGYANTYVYTIDRQGFLFKEEPCKKS